MSHKKELRKKLEAELPDLPDDNHVLKFKAWCKVAGVCERTGRRLVKEGRGPTITMLTSKLFGVTNRNHRIWLAERSRS